MDVGGAWLRSIVASPEHVARLRAAASEAAAEAAGGPRGTWWLPLGAWPELEAHLWLRFCPSGAVVPAHEHAEPFVGLVLEGLYKQVLLGVGGGVASPAGETTLCVRHERHGQVFALAAGQRHSSASSVGLVMLVLAPAPPAALEGAAPHRAVVRKLRAAAAALEPIRRGGGGA